MRDAVGAQAESERRPRAAVLRKDFIIDAYQLLEARAHGADTALLIVAILEDDLLASLIARARALGMEPLVEVNSVEELSRALVAGAEVIGVNNRNLHTFRVDLGTTERVARALAEHNAKLAAETANAKSERGGAGARQESDSVLWRSRCAPPYRDGSQRHYLACRCGKIRTLRVRGVLVGEPDARSRPRPDGARTLSLNGPRDISLLPPLPSLQRRPPLPQRPCASKYVESATRHRARRCARGRRLYGLISLQNPSGV